MLFPGRAEEARRSFRASATQALVAAGVSAVPRWRASSAASGSLGPAAGPAAAARIALRSASDFETPQCRAISSSRLTVPGSREYVAFTVVVAIPEEYGHIP